MPMRHFKCETCGRTTRTLKADTPSCAHGSLTPEYATTEFMVEVLVAPAAKMMETIDKENGKSRLKDQQKILKARSRIHARDYEADDLIQMNKDNGIERIGFLRKDGKKRTKIDDL